MTGKTITPQSIQSLLERIQDNERRKRVARLARAYSLDFIDTRRVVLLLEHDTGIPNPAAVAMVRSIRGKPMGSALAKVEEAMDMLEHRIPLTAIEQLVSLALLDHLQKWIEDLRQRIQPTDIAKQEELQ